MKSIYYILYGIFTTALLGSCASEAPNQQTSTSDSENKSIQFRPVHPSQSRVTDDAFETSDKIGIFMTQGEEPLQASGNYINNALLSFNGSAWEPATPVYWDKGTYTAYAYYPYNRSVQSVDDYSLSVSVDQSTASTEEALGGYEASDFLWSKADNLTASSEPVSLAFSHRMSRLDIRLIKGEDYEGEIPDDAVVYIHNTITEATADLSVGIVTPSRYATSKTIITKPKGGHKYSAILVPQRLANRVPLIEVVMKGVSYLVESKFLFKPGICHKISIIIAKNPEQVKIEIGGELEDWQ